MVHMHVKSFRNNKWDKQNMSHVSKTQLFQSPTRGGQKVSSPNILNYNFLQNLCISETCILYWEEFAADMITL